MRRIEVSLIVVFILAICMPAQAAWVSEVISSQGDQGQWGSVALDSQGDPHAAWYDATNGRLMYGRREIDGWNTQQVDYGQMGKYASIDINPTNDYPAIAYFDEGDTAAMYAWWDGSTWDTEVIDNKDDDRGEWIDLVFTSGGMPFVSYHYDNGGLHTVGVSVAWKDGSTWNILEKLDSTTSTIDELGNYTAIALDSFDYPQVAFRYDGFFHQNQKFGWQDGLGWHQEDAILSDVSGEWADIALDSGDNVYISFYDWDTLDEECASVAIKTSGNWSKQTVECGNGYNVGLYTSIDIDSEDRPHVTYYGNGMLRYAIRNSRGWARETVDDSGDTGLHTSLALDEDDNPHITYYNYTTKDMMYAFDLGTPTLTSITPNHGTSSNVLSDVVLEGENFYSTMSVTLYFPATEQEITGDGIALNSEEELVCDIDLTDAYVGVYDVIIETPAGTYTLEDGFTIDAPSPILGNVTPGSGANDDEAKTLTVTGSYFYNPVSLQLQNGAYSSIAETVQIDSPQQVQGTFDLTGLATGIYDLVVSTNYGSDLIEDAFIVACGIPNADFQANPTSGSSPMNVYFWDDSATHPGCSATAWEWDFGDGGTSVERNPQHIYETSGIFSVSMKVTSPGGFDTDLKNNLIRVDVPDDDDDDNDDDDDDDTTPPDDDDDDDNDDDDNDDTTPPDDDDDDVVDDDDDITDDDDDDNGGDNLFDDDDEPEDRPEESSDDSDSEGGSCGF